MLQLYTHDKYDNTVKFKWSDYHYKNLIADI